MENEELFFVKFSSYHRIVYHRDSYGFLIFFFMRDELRLKIEDHIIEGLTDYGVHGYFNNPEYAKSLDELDKIMIAKYGNNYYHHTFTNEIMNIVRGVFNKL